MFNRASLVSQTVKHLSAMQETWVRSLGWEVPLEKEMAAHSTILAWKIPWMAEPNELKQNISNDQDIGILKYLFKNIPDD